MFVVCNLEVTDGEIFPVVGVENSIHILPADEPLLTQATRSQKGEAKKNYKKKAMKQSGAGEEGAKKRETKRAKIKDI